MSTRRRGLKARVRVLGDYEDRNMWPGTTQHWKAGEEHVLVFWGPQDRAKQFWGTEDRSVTGWLIPAELVQVIEVLEP